MQKNMPLTSSIDLARKGEPLDFNMHAEGINKDLGVRVTHRVIRLKALSCFPLYSLTEFQPMLNI